MHVAHTHSLARNCEVAKGDIDDEDGSTCASGVTGFTMNDDCSNVEVRLTDSM